MFGMLASFLSKMGILSAGMGSNACAAWWIEEPECPKSLIK